MNEIPSVPANGVTDAQNATSLGSSAGGLAVGPAVTDPPFNAIDDGVKGYFTCTWEVGRPELTAYTGITAITVANSGPSGVARVTFPGALGCSGIGPQMSWLGKP